MPRQIGDLDAPMAEAREGAVCRNDSYYAVRRDFLWRYPSQEIRVAKELSIDPEWYQGWLLFLIYFYCQNSRCCWCWADF